MEKARLPRCALCPASLHVRAPSGVRGVRPGCRVFAMPGIWTFLISLPVYVMSFLRNIELCCQAHGNSPVCLGKSLCSLAGEAPALVATLAERVRGFLKAGAVVDPGLPLEKIPFVVIDTELTGLDAKRDSIVSVGAVKMSGTRIELARVAGIDPERVLRATQVIVDEGLAMGGCESIHTVIVFKRTGGACNMVAGRDPWLHDAVANQSDVCEPEWVEAEHPLFLLYTSGSTGKPKGVQHSTGGYLLWAALTMQWTFDLKDSDVFWCTADIGWVTGHTYITYGPLACGATEILSLIHI